MRPKESTLFGDTFFFKKGYETKESALFVCVINHGHINATHANASDKNPSWTPSQSWSKNAFYVHERLLVAKGFLWPTALTLRKWARVVRVWENIHLWDLLEFAKPCLFYSAQDLQTFVKMFLTKALTASCTTIHANTFSYKHDSVQCFLSLFFLLGLIINNFPFFRWHFL